MDTQEKDFLGLVNENQFCKTNWFIKFNDPVKLNYDACLRIQAIAHRIQIRCFAGSWCSDTWIQLPRLIQVLDACNVPSSHRFWIFVDRTKSCPEFPPEAFHVQYIPTCIIYLDEIEIGRIVEHPLTESIEMDLCILLKLM